jgi:hypothetical protein
MLDDDLICEAGIGEDEDPVYEITDKGRCVAESLHSEILSSILDKSLAAALRYLDFKQRGVEVHCHHTRREDGRFEVHCALLEKDTVIFETTLVVNSADHAKRMADNFRDRPEVIYRGAHALLAGNMNFLLD